MGECRRCRPAARRRHGGRRRLGDGVARLARIFRPDMADHLEVARHIIQNLGDILTKLCHPMPTIRAKASTIVIRFVNDFLPGQVIRQRFAFRFGALTDRQGRALGFGRRDVLCLTGFQVFKLQLELLDLASNPFRRAPELQAPELGNLKLEFLDLQRTQLNRKLRRFQFGLACCRKSAQRIKIGR
jgi:hypothetical protein